MVAVSTFYIDDSGTRHPDHKAKEAQHGHDWFALGGILIDDDNIQSANAEIDAFRTRWPQLADAPLHSSEIRGQHKNNRAGAAAAAKRKDRMRPAIAPKPI